MMPGDMDRPDRYALAVSAEHPEWCSGRRSTLFALAIRANTVCRCVVGGQWLVDAVGLHAGNVRNHVNALADTGIFAVNHMPGSALVVQFPAGEVIHTPAHRCAGCRAWGRALVRATPRVGTRGPRVPARAVTVSNSVKTTADLSDVSSLSVEQVRSIWMTARNEGRTA